MALLDLIDSLNAFAGAIDTFVDAQPDPYSATCQRLRRTEQSVIDYANDIAAAAARQISDEINSAVARLQVNIDSAKQTLARIKDATVAIGVGAAVLAAAAAVASGGVLTTASGAALLALAQQVAAAVNAASAG
ncbi:MAG: hypothetical protein ACREFP_09905 [Acetobacteraceae bacterium]